MVSGFLKSDKSRYIVAILAVTTSVVDDLEYLLLGHNKKAATLHTLLDRDTCPLAAALHKYWCTPPLNMLIRQSLECPEMSKSGNVIRVVFMYGIEATAK